MRERGFDDVAGMIRAFGGPIPKARPKAMWHGRNAQFFGPPRQRVVRQRLPLPGEDEPAPVAQAPRVGQNRDGPFAQRNAVLTLHFHARGGDGPHGRVHVDFVPPGQAHFSRPGRREHQELKRELDGDQGSGRSYGRDRAGHRTVGQGGHVALYERLSRPRLGQCVAGRIVQPIALSHGPLHDRPDLPAHAPRRVGLGVPDRCEDGEHVGRRYLGDHSRADVRMGVGLKPRLPIPRSLRVAPAGTVERNHLGGGFRERGHAPRKVPLSEWVSTRPGELPVHERLFARLGQRHDRAAAEPEGPGPASDHEPLFPAAGARGVDEQIQAVAVAVAPGLGDGSDKGGRKRLVGMPPAWLGPASCLGVGVHKLFNQQLIL